MIGHGGKWDCSFEKLSCDLGWCEIFYRNGDPQHFTLFGLNFSMNFCCRFFGARDELKGKDACKEEGEDDLQALTGALLNLKEQYPDKEDATVLLEPDIEYNDMIAVMDTVKFHDVASEDGEDNSRVLFPEISIGDAP